MKSLPANLDFSAFARRAAAAREADPRRLAIVGRNLIDGALRIRHSEPVAVGEDDVIGSWLPKVTKPTEAIGAWLKSLSEQAESGEPFFRSAEMREAVIAAGEEVDTAVQASPTAGRLRHALYSDALDAIAGQDKKPPVWPWIVGGVIGGGILVSLLVLIFQRRRR